MPNSSFDALAAGVPARIGVALAHPGATGAAHSLGQWSTGVAWSTIKVPLAIAALRRDPERAKPLVVKAITESDNPASEELWAQLGAPAVAARHVQAVFKAAGDPATAVEKRRIRPGFTAFGQTRWTLARQAVFAANLPDVAGSAPVIDLMRRLTAEQRWGLAAKGVAAKGGWGPGADGGYLVRQFAVVPLDRGRLGVALAAEAASFQTGVRVLSTMADWLVDQLSELARG